MDDAQIVKDDKIKRAFARISSIRKNLGPQFGSGTIAVSSWETISVARCRSRDVDERIGRARQRARTVRHSEPL
jgi:hypothetical protein